MRARGAQLGLWGGLVLRVPLLMSVGLSKKGLDLQPKQPERACVSHRDTRAMESERIRAGTGGHHPSIGAKRLSFGTM